MLNGLLIPKIHILMETIIETFISRNNITMHENSHIDKLDSSLYNGK